MAVDFAAIANTLSTIFEDRIANQINRATVLLQLLPVGNGTGKNISWPVRFGTAVGSTIADGADVSVYNNDTKVPASLDYGTYNDAFSVTGKALAAALAAGNPDELEDLFADELGDCIERVAKKVSQDLWTGTGATDHIAGLLASAGPLDTTGTYAGLSRSTYTQWASNVDDNSGTDRALTFNLMRRMRTTIYNASGLKPDLIVTTPELLEKYGTLFAQQRRYVQEIFLRGQKILLDGGYQMLEFDGIPIVEDVDCTADTMVFLNTALCKVAQLPDPITQVNQSMGALAIQGTEEEQFGLGRGRLIARINPLARAGDAYKFQLILYPQLQVKRCNAFGVLKNVNADL